MAGRNLEDSTLKLKLWHLFRDYFDMAEKKRRWNGREDIPWGDCNKNLDPAISDVVWTFCAVELFLPDYLSESIPMVRDNRGRAWMFANWGYEELKHSMALGDWLLHSGWRTEEEMQDLEAGVFKQEYDLPYDNPLFMVCYTTFQELATGVHYRNLRRVIGGKCPALDKALNLISIDESAHADFFRKVFETYLEFDRHEALGALHEVIKGFQMPAVNLLIDGKRRAAAVKELNIFDEATYYGTVVTPILEKLGVSKQEMKVYTKRERTVVPAPVPAA
jgi:acyl-[acyl-carrier-protein] desaturase